LHNKHNFSINTQAAFNRTTVWTWHFKINLIQRKSCVLSIMLPMTEHLAMPEDMDVGMDRTVYNFDADCKPYPDAYSPVHLNEKQPVQHDDGVSAVVQEILLPQAAQSPPAAGPGYPFAQRDWITLNCMPSPAAVPSVSGDFNMQQPTQHIAKLPEVEPEDVSPIILLDIHLKASDGISDLVKPWLLNATNITTCSAIWAAIELRHQSAYYSALVETLSPVYWEFKLADAADYERMQSAGIPRMSSNTSEHTSAKLAEADIKWEHGYWIGSGSGSDSIEIAYDRFRARALAQGRYYATTTVEPFRNMTRQLKSLSVETENLSKDPQTVKHLGDTDSIRTGATVYGIVEITFL
jgi:hypothetical protein